MTEHPMQDIITDSNGTPRFRANALVLHLLDRGGIDMNDLAVEDFPPEDRRQFAQLIGYSLSGYGELRSYVRDEDYLAATAKMESGGTDDRARAKALQTLLDQARRGMREGVAALYGIHEDDLGEPGCPTPN